MQKGPEAVDHDSDYTLQSPGWNFKYSSAQDPQKFMIIGLG